MSTGFAFERENALIRNSHKHMYLPTDHPEGPSTNIMRTLGFYMRNYIIWFGPSAHYMSTWTLLAKALTCELFQIQALWEQDHSTYLQYRI